MKHLRFVFENCESITINGYITFDKITDNIIDNVIITIPKSENGVSDSNFGYDNENDNTTKFARLKKYNDICCIKFLDEDVEYDVKWCDDDYGQNNLAQSYHYDRDNLIIEINTNKAKHKKQNNKVVRLIDTYMEQNESLSFYDVLGKIKSFNNQNEIIEFLQNNIKEDDEYDY